MVDDTACAGTADKTILAPVFTSPVATQATRLKTILPERVAIFQANYFWETKAGNPQISWISQKEKSCGVRRGVAASNSTRHHYVDCRL